MSGPQDTSGNGQRQRVVLTGASRGIGHATVKRFSDEGWEVITCSRDEVPADCRRDPNWTHHITADLADQKALSRFVAEAKAIIGDGPVHALVNNAAVSPKTEFKERLGCLNGSLDLWREVFELNFFAPLALGRGFASPLRKRSEEHTSELQSLMRISYAVFCLKKKTKNTHISQT